MNKHVLEHIPVSQLPAELRERLRGVRTVTITAENGTGLSRSEAVAAIRARQNDQLGRGVSSSEAVARVRGLRQEWDD